jgi:uncharacterized SAM-binding protein YcdF (DUF218 family)
MKTFIIFSSVDWFSFRQMHHQLTDSLVSDNYKVLFVDNTGVRNVKITDYKRVFDRLKNFFNSLGGFKVINSNLTVLSPIIFPSPYSKFFILINTFILRYFLNKWGKLFNLNETIIITFLPTPLISNLVEKLQPKLCLYYCANNMSEGSSGAKKLKKYENNFIKRSNIVFTISKNLFENSKKINPKTFNIPPGVDFDRFRNFEKKTNILEDINNPIIGYIGALSDVLDYDLILKIANKFKHTSIVLIGPNLVNNKKIINIENIYLLGEVENKLLPNFLDKFNIALIPYLKNSFTDSVYSCKTSEYLSLGLPVVSTNIDEIVNFNKEENNIIDIGNNHQEFLDHLKNNIDNLNNDQKYHDRIKVAEKNSWKSRYKKLSQIVNEESEFIDSQRERKKYILDKTISYFKRLNLIKILTYSFIFYLLLFKTPFFNFVGNKLILEEVPVISDVIVVFSGSGYASYINPSYQQRAVDVLDYYFKGYAKKIILSSGRDQLISEVEILRSILLNRNVPDEDIIILEEYPTNTLENVILVRKILKKLNYNSIIFITGPYHSLRSKLIWQKNFPEIKVIPVKAIDSPLDEKKLRNFSEIYTICYEYLAIIYNKFKNRL